jgi:hypothetical protein
MKNSNTILVVVILVLFAIHQVLVSQKMKAKDDRINELEIMVREYQFNIHTDSIIKSHVKAFEKKLDSSYNKIFTK